MYSVHNLYRLSIKYLSTSNNLNNIWVEWQRFNSFAPCNLCFGLLRRVLLLEKTKNFEKLWDTCFFNFEGKLFFDQFFFWWDTPPVAGMIDPTFKILNRMVYIIFFERSRQEKCITVSCSSLRQTVPVPVRNLQGDQKKNAQTPPPRLTFGRLVIFEFCKVLRA